MTRQNDSKNVQSSILILSYVLSPFDQILKKKSWIRPYWAQKLQKKTRWVEGMAACSHSRLRTYYGRRGTNKADCVWVGRKILEAKGKSRSTTFVQREKRNFQTAQNGISPRSRSSPANSNAISFTGILGPFNWRYWQAPNSLTWTYICIDVYAYAKDAQTELCMNANLSTNILVHNWYAEVDACRRHTNRAVHIDSSTECAHTVQKIQSGNRPFTNSKVQPTLMVGSLLCALVVACYVR